MLQLMLPATAGPLLKAVATVGVFVVSLRRHKLKTQQQENHEKATTPATNGHSNNSTSTNTSGSPKKHVPPILAGPRPCMGDLSLLETVINLVTCVPYFRMARAVRPSTKFWNRIFSVSCSFTGICAVLYHLSMGPIRHFFRRLDYTAVALSAVSLTVARSPTPKPMFYAALSTVVSPFQPLLVAACHVLGTEFAFFKKALEDPKLRETHMIHTVSGVLAFGAFYADDWFPQVPYLHATWHLLSAYATSLTPCLIEL